MVIVRSMFWPDQGMKTRPFVRLNNSAKSDSSSFFVLTGLLIRGSYPRTGVRRYPPWFSHRPVDARRLAAVAPEVAGVENTLSGVFD